MKVAYVDTSWVVAIAFGEASAATRSRKLDRYDEIVSSNLLEAELRAALVRENVSAEPLMLDAIGWILPDRPLGAEIRQVLSAGYIRGADLWHLACALFLAPNPKDLAFLTLDQRQRDVAKSLGFRVS